jgi:hypothetical protein
LVKELGARRLRKAAPLSGWKKGDTVLCWGSYFKAPAGVVVVNSSLVGSKIQELTLLAEKGIVVPPFNNTAVTGWLGRTANHQEGKDLLHGTKNPAFWTKKLNVVREFRVHVINGMSVKVGHKKPRNDKPHPWIRSWDAGWGIYYDAGATVGFSKKGREMAKKAAEVLGLTACAVDLWLLEDGKWVVGEVNRRPALPEDSGVLKKYGEQLRILLGLSSPQAVAA